MKNSINSARRIAFAAALAVISASSFAAPINSVDNSGFEASNIGSAYFYLGGHVVDNWTYAGNAGIAGNNSGFQVSNASGNEAAFLQDGGSSISQMFTFTGSLFSVSFLAESRYVDNVGFIGNDISVLIDGVALMFNGATSFIPGTSSTFTKYSSDYIALSAGDHTISFIGNGVNNTDVTSFIDDVTLTAATVPEPVTLGLFGLGLLALGAARRKVKQHA